MSAPAVAGAAEAPTKPIRTLVYSVMLSTRNINTIKENGIRSMGDGESRNISTADDDGKLTVDVIAATPDGGLVVDASYAGALTVQPPIRVAIFGDGRIMYNLKLPLSVPALRILPLLARGLFSGHEISAGQTWSASDDSQAPRFTVQSVNDPDATIAMKQTLVPVAGAKQYIAGTAVYDTSKSRPDDFKSTATMERPNGADQMLNSTETFHAKLTSDTFDKK